MRKLFNVTSASFILIIAVVIIRMVFPPHITRNQFDRIQIGMDRKEVERILGLPFSIDQPGDVDILQFRGEQRHVGSILISRQQAQVISASWIDDVEIPEGELTWLWLRELW